METHRRYQDLLTLIAGDKLPAVNLCVVCITMFVVYSDFNNGERDAIERTVSGGSGED